MYFFNAYKNVKYEQLIDEYLHGWCYYFQKILAGKLNGSEKYEIWDKTCDTNGEFYNDHQVIKYKNHYIDIRGIFTEEEMLQVHKNEHVNLTKKLFKNADTSIESYLKEKDYTDDEMKYNSDVLIFTENVVNLILNEIHLFFGNE